MIKIEGLSKDFRIYRRRSGIIREALGIARPEIDYDVVRSLSGISLEVPDGSVHGIIGMNGAGKSTLLKILTGVLKPTSGHFHYNGRVAALLELGTGFHGELTGRENIFLNSSIMGLSHEEVRQKLEEIITFAELGDFFDRPVRIYSSGMYVRLAFSFAVAVEPDLLIIDEALSVGDAYFQQKCLKRILEFKSKKVTILFVSHDLGAVKVLCDRVSVLSQGKLIFTGSTLQGMDLYNALLAEHKDRDLVEKRISTASVSAFENSFESGNRKLEIIKVEMLDAFGTPVHAIVTGATVIIAVTVRCNVDRVEDPTCGILIRDRLGYDIFGTNSHFLGVSPQVMHRGDEVCFRFSQEFNLGSGDYVLTTAIHEGQSHIGENYHWIERAALIKVVPSPNYQFIGVSRLNTHLSLTSHPASALRQ